MHVDDPQQPELLRVCRIGRAQGLKGEVTVQIFTDEPEYRFAPGAVLYTKDGEEEIVVEHSRTFKNRWIIKFEGIDNRDSSEAANGTVLYGEADDPEEMLQADEWLSERPDRSGGTSCRRQHTGTRTRYGDRQGRGCD